MDVVILVFSLKVLCQLVRYFQILLSSQNKVDFNILKIQDYHLVIIFFFAHSVQKSLKLNPCLFIFSFSWHAYGHHIFRLIRFVTINFTKYLNFPKFLNHLTNKKVLSYRKISLKVIFFIFRISPFVWIKFNRSI